jgi:glycosidase
MLRALLTAAVLLAAVPAVAERGLKLHVPSPDWRDQVIYFVMTDRFADGDTRNNNQGAGEYDPQDPAKYSGGDLRGLMQRLDYVQGLGATAVWITPPVANRWWDPQSRFSGYHGYWAEHFMKLDKHLGTLDDYKRLSDALHRRGMYLVQDIVVNHTGNFFSYAGGWEATDPARYYVPNADARGVSAPSQKPFSLNDPRQAAHRKAGIYHWTPDVRDYSDEKQERNFQMSGLDDLNTENPVVREGLRKSHGYWIGEVGVDAFRVDTAFYVPPDFYADFLYHRSWKAPGVIEAAKRTGRRQFHVFGEGFGIDKPGENKEARKIESFVRTAGGQPLMPGMLNFPLYGSLNQVFARGAPTRELGFRIGSMMQVHSAPHLMPTFIDNHDVDRFLAGGNEAGLRQALLALMTLPGIPVIYYGTEQGFTEPRAAMFAAGHGSQGKDHFDTQAPLYRLLTSLTTLRRAHPVLSRGTPRVLYDNAAGAGALMWAMEGGGQSEKLFVAINSSDAPALVDNAELRLGAGAQLAPLYAQGGAAPLLTAEVNGRASFVMPAKSGWVWRAAAATAPQAPAAATTAQLTISAPPSNRVAGDLSLQGSAGGLARFQLVVDGQLQPSQTVTPGGDGRWRATLDTGAMVDPQVAHRVVAWADGVASQPLTFFVQRDWTLLADVADPVGDDHGPQGHYRYPLDPSWGPHRQLDIQRMRVFGAGGSLRIEMTMNEVTRSWNPANGFDHVAFTIFIEVPGREGGATVMPRQYATVPPGMRWHYRLRAHGWSNALFSANGADAQNDGQSATPAAHIEVDVATRRVIFTLPAAALGGLKTLSGVKVYASTWDYDGGYRELGPEPRKSTFGGARSPTDALVMDDTVVVTLP